MFSRKKRILVVDDEVGIGKLIQRLIESEDLEVELAHSAEQARQLFYKNHFPVVLLDLDLPDACGIQLLQEFKAKRPRSLYIVMTGLSTTRTAVKAIQLGAYDFLEKPFDNISALKKLIKEAFQFYLEKFEHVPYSPAGKNWPGATGLLSENRRRCSVWSRRLTRRRLRISAS